MCDSVTQKAIEDIVITKVNAQDMFTAWDITVESRSQGIQAQHHEIKLVVHGFFDSGSMGTDYKRVLHDVGAQVQPWLYYPKSANPKDYNTPANFPPKKAVQSGPSISIGLPQSLSPNVAKADKRGTVCIPKTAIKNAGLNPGDTAYVYPVPNNNRLIVVKDPADAGGSQNFKHRIYRVDCNGNIRLTKKSLILANIPVGSKGQQYSVLQQGKTISIAP